MSTAKETSRALASRLKAFRKANRLTLEDVSRKTELSVSHLAGFENGSRWNITLKVAWAISGLLNSPIVIDGTMPEDDLEDEKLS
jgi:transcriptional regulator with XRE-family HTH domain